MKESLNFDQIADRYDATRGGEARGRQIGGDVARLLRKGRPVLEIGVGTGVIAKALTALGFDVFGVDISAQMLVRARERIGSRVVRGDAMQLPFRTASVDQIVAVWVFHVVADPSVALREVARVLTPGSKAFVVDGKHDFDENDPISVSYREIEAAFGLEHRLGRVHDWAKLAPLAGLHVAEIVDAGPYPIVTTIAEHAQNIATRAHSWMWKIPDDEWDRVATPIVERLRAMPAYDEPMRRDGFQEILVLTA